MKSSLDLTSVGFVLSNARFLIRACARTYDVGADNPDSVAIGCPDNAVPTLAQAMLTAYDDCLVLAFRGTHNLHDWLTDADFPLRPTCAGRVHAGFLRALDNLWPSLLAAIATHGIPLSQHRGVPADYSPSPRLSRHPVPLDCSREGEGRLVVPKPFGEGGLVRHSFTGGGGESGGNLVPPVPDCARLPLLITGHSLGGALALLCAHRLALQTVPIHSVHTFGQPRVGDHAFAAAYDSLLGDRTYRVVNQNDVVPRLPGVLLGYQHAGHLAFLNGAGRLVGDPALLTLLANDLFGLARAWRQWEDVLVTGHFVGAYLAALDRVSVPLFSPGHVTSVPSTHPEAWPF